MDAWFTAFAVLSSCLLAGAGTLLIMGYIGTVPAAIDSVTTSYQVLGTAVSGCNSTCTGTTTLAACTDLSSALVETYLSAIPMDPSTGTAANTDYAVDKTAAGRIEVKACDPEVATTISVKR